jgi:hypothetical protein
MNDIDISKNCVLVNLSIRSWIANKQDSAVATEVAQAKGVQDTKMGRYWKSLLPKCAELDAVNQAMGKARAFHYANTLSYMHDGPRILPTAHFDAYQAAMATLRTEFDLAVNALIAKYDTLKTDAKVLMGSLYNELDYPDKGYVKSRYGIETTFMPMPSADVLLDLGFDMSSATDMKVRLESELTERFRKNARALWEQLDTNVETLLKTLGDAKKSIRNESLEASRRLATLLPKLNVVEDKRLNLVCERLLKVLDGVTHSILSVDRVRRHVVDGDLRLVSRTIHAAMAGASLQEAEVVAETEPDVTAARLVA